MVAYSFKSFFAPQIIAGLKCQTVRADRRRHARPGEAVQLYTGMRTRACHKLVTPDPLCTQVRRIIIATSRLVDGIVSIEIEGVLIEWSFGTRPAGAPQDEGSGL
jgi:hypothetical protein